MARIKMHIPKAKLPFYPPYEVKYRLQNGVSTKMHYERYLGLPSLVGKGKKASFNYIKERV